MTNEILLAEQFEAERPRLRGMALRMLGNEPPPTTPCKKPGSAWSAPTRGRRGEQIANLPGWLTTVVSRICLDVLRGVPRAARRPGPTRPTSSTGRRPLRTRQSWPTPSARR